LFGTIVFITIPPKVVISFNAFFCEYLGQEGYIIGTIFDPSLILKYFPKILSCLHITLAIVLVATVAGLILGTGLALIRLYKIPVANQIAGVFISFQRGTPILVQLFIVYYGLPALLYALLGINVNGWDKLIFVMVTYALSASSFFSETIRGAIASVPKSQSEAAYSIGMTGKETFFRIIAPQAVKIAIPGLGVGILSLLQDTSLAFSLGIMDVMGKVKAIGGATYHSLEGYIGAAIIFVILNFILEVVFSRIGNVQKYTSKTNERVRKLRGHTV
jgi:L-cystine transport system permease protein